MSGLLLPGVLNVTLDEAIGVGIPALKNRLLYDVQMYDVVTANRTKADGNVSFTNFIETQLDINKKISYIASATGKNADDAYALEDINITMNDSVNPNYSLPSTIDVVVEAGSIEAVDPESDLLGIFPVKLRVSCNENGIMETDIAICGQDVPAEAIDNPNQAQKVYWGSNKPQITPDSEDILSSLLTNIDIKNQFNNEIKIIEDLYSVNIIKDWDFHILPVNSATNNIPNVLDAYAEIKNRTFPNIFLDGEHIILKTGYPYKYTIEDYNGDIQYVIEETPIYARITHNDNADNI